jgi:hypothetical protein
MMTISVGAKPKIDKAGLYIKELQNSTVIWKPR